MLLSELIKSLEGKLVDGDHEVEFIVVTAKSQLIAMFLENQARHIGKVLAIFGGK